MADTATDLLIDTFHDRGMKVVFALPGDSINGIMEASRKRANFESVEGQARTSLRMGLRTTKSSAKDEES